ncbi:MAG: hypothetical protein FWE88_08885 [Phycisphaerae bacterium]|nr:hypothetical protein [Phycisphaerae bacterium]
MNNKKKASRAGDDMAKGKSTRASAERRCPHCGYRMAAKDVPPGPVKLCPTCRMILPQDHLA